MYYDVDKRLLLIIGSRGVIIWAKLTNAKSEQQARQITRKSHFK